MSSTSWSLLPDDEVTGAALGRAQATFTPGVDWALDESGDLEFPLRYTTGSEAVAQGLKIRLNTFLGEWFLDLDFGVPWFEEILGQKFSEVRVRAALRDVILSTPGVLAIVALGATYSNRTVSITCTVSTTEGLVTSEVERS